jgi:Flp pilus assembly pilin Flp
MRKLLNALKRDERGVSALEYVILAVVVVAAVAALKEPISTMYSSAFGAMEESVTNTIENTNP